MKLYGEILYIHRLDTQTLRLVHADGLVDVFFDDEEESAVERLENHCPDAFKWFAIHAPAADKPDDTASVFIVYDAPKKPERFMTIGQFERTLPSGLISGSEATRSKVLTEREQLKVIATIEAVSEYDPSYTKFVRENRGDDRVIRGARELAPF